MFRAFALVYGVVAYAFFFVTFVYAIGFVGNLVVPRTVDSGGPSSVPGAALLINSLLLGLFAVQHSVMARKGFKKVWTKIVPPPIERSTYVLLSTAILALLMWQWRPIPGTIWSVENVVGQTVFWALFVLGWGLVFLATFLINHWDLFGIRQVWLYFQGKPYEPLKFQATSVYRYVRHPLLLGFLIAFWATPHMTTGHFLFSLATTAYILIGIYLEERDLVRAHGSTYQRYRDQVPMLIPWKGGKDVTQESEASVSE